METEKIQEIDHAPKLKTIYHHVAITLGYCRCATISNELGKRVKLEQIENKLIAILLAIDNSKTPDEAIRNASD